MPACGLMVSTFAKVVTERGSDPTDRRFPTHLIVIPRMPQPYPDFEHGDDSLPRADRIVSSTPERLPKSLSKRRMARLIDEFRNSWQGISRPSLLFSVGFSIACIAVSTAARWFLATLRPD